MDDRREEDSLSGGSDDRSAEPEYAEDSTTELDFFLDVQERGHRFGIMRTRKGASVADSAGEAFNAISNFIIEIKGEVRAAEDGSSLTGYLCEVIFHNGKNLG